MQHDCSNLDLPAETHASKGIMISFLWQPSRCVVYSKETNVVQFNMMGVGLQPHHSRGFIKYNNSPSCVISLHYNLLFLSLCTLNLVLALGDMPSTCWCCVHQYTQFSFLFFCLLLLMKYQGSLLLVFYKSCQKWPFGALMQGSRCDLLQFK